MEGLKIGITVNIKSADEALWTNGIKLNVLILYRMLKKSSKNYDVCLLNTGEFPDERRPTYLDGVPIYNIKDKYEDIDLMIVMGAQVEAFYMMHFKIKEKKRVVSYRCGNNYIIAAESVLFKESKDGIYQYESEFDELWYIPQQHETNCGYYHTMYRVNALIVPFVWSQFYLFNSLIEIEKSFQSGKFKKSHKYDSAKEKKAIGIMEPNLNILKFGLLPLMIAEESYRGKVGKEKIEKVVLTNSEMIAKHKEFLGMISTFDLYRDNKISSESRYQTAYIITQFIDVLVCHQLLNPLNYLYLDVAYMGYPVLHNAPLCKDLGYYYEGSDTIAGAKKLDWILKNHDKNIDKYNEKNKAALQRYHSDNPELIETYDKLIYNLFNGGNNGLEYDPETNLYKNI